MARALEGLAPNDNPTGAAYGAVAVGLVFAVENPEPGAGWSVLGAIVVAVAAYWLVHAYAWRLGARLRAGGDPDESPSLASALWHERTILIGAAPSIASFLVVLLLGFDLTEALAAGTGTAAVVVVGLESIAGRKLGLRGVRWIGEVVAGATLGIGILAAYALVHG